MRVIQKKILCLLCGLNGLLRRGFYYSPRVAQWLFGIHLITIQECRFFARLHITFVVGCGEDSRSVMSPSHDEPREDKSPIDLVKLNSLARDHRR